MTSKIIQTVTVLLITAAMVVGVGCAAMSEYVTPASIDRNAVDKAVSAGLADPGDYDGYANLHKARRLKVQVAAAHEIIMLGIEQRAQEEQLDDNILRGIMERSVSDAQELEAAIFDPTTGLLAAGLGVLGVSAGGLIGLMRKRPNDWEPAEVDAALAEVNLELDAKQRQFVEVVKQVQQFKDSAKKTDDPDLVGAVELLSSFLRSQSKDTSAAVAIAKVS